MTSNLEHLSLDASPGFRECIHGLEPAWCALCLRAGQPLPRHESWLARFAPEGDVTIARNSHRCAGCDFLVEKGAQIQMWTDGDRRQWLHADCAIEA